ncbi:phage head closure protein [Pseudomonas sp. B21-015]|uniref:phage head closure protein n=1 Tax=Pseudomonas sp. B21-015 TaxID=2895473 RepID=UPI002160FE64|nr:phage head closure protein [Pseudomonas sp. B21-015]UVM48344.1 phage head closure protein [Pseudomonas sp. B21-015]
MAMREPSAGELDRRITIRLRTDIPAPDQGLDSVFTEQKKRWAKIEPVGTAVYANGVQTDVKITHRVIFYYLKGMSDAHEVLHGSIIYRVCRVADMNGTRRYTLLEVEEQGPERPGGGIYG